MMKQFGLEHFVLQIKIKLCMHTRNTYTHGNKISNSNVNILPI